MMNNENKAMPMNEENEITTNNFNKMFVDILKLPNFIRKQVKSIFPKLEDVIVYPNMKVTKKDFHIRRIYLKDLVTENYHGRLRHVVNIATYKKNEDIKVLLFYPPTWTRNGVFSVLSDGLAFYDKKYHRTMMSRLNRGYEPKRIDDNVYNISYSEHKGYLNNIQDYIRDERLYDKLYKNTIGFLKNPPKSMVSIKRGIMLHGKQGTGKTAILKDLIKDCMKEKIYTFIIDNSESIRGGLLNKLTYFSKKYKPSIFIFEDFDSFLISREENIHNDNSVMKSLLSFLDGFYTRDKNVVIFTSNYMERIDKAIKRPGRIDIMLEFDYPTNDLIEKYFKKRNLTNRQIEVYMDALKGKLFSWAMICELVNRQYFDNNGVYMIRDEIEKERKAIEKSMGFRVSK